MPKNYFILAYYLFTPIEDPHAEVRKQHAFLAGKNATGRIYISHEGINGQMSASASDAELYMEWLRSDPRFAKIEFKIHTHSENVFPRMTVKFRKQLVALDRAVDFSKQGKHVSPEEWKRLLEERDENTLVLDVRNDYEWKIGHFEGSELPTLEQFRAFPAFAKKLKESKDPKKTHVMMCCTGGIRCELYSALLKEEGFEQVTQLEGGIINYGLKVGSAHWVGKLFVFDDRLAVQISEKEPTETISQCHACGTPSDTYYNCANMDCNELFLSCPTCAQKSQGCCSERCQEAERVRPFEPSDKPKPFRKKHLLPDPCPCDH
jgi:UPF0176 protein